MLGVTRGASASEIQKAYRKLAKKYHPDVSKEPDAEARFREIGEAYEVLRDDERRGLYDKWGPQWKAISEGRAPQPGSVDDARFDFGGFSNVNDLNVIFEQVFGGRGPGRSRAGRRGKGRRGDQETTLELGVAKAFAGGRRDIQFVDPQTGEKRRLSVSIPSGVRGGQKIRLAGQAAAGRGDLFLRVRVVPDEHFRLEGDDVYVTLRVTPSEAALGCAAPLHTLEGEVKIRVPPGSPSGRRIRIKGRGYPGKGGRRGDLYAEISVVVPPEPTAEERQLYEQLARISTYDPRT